MTVVEAVVDQSVDEKLRISVGRIILVCRWLLKMVFTSRWLQVREVVGFFPAPKNTQLSSNTKTYNTASIRLKLIPAYR